MEVVGQLVATRQGCVSSQVLGEFFVVVTRRIQHPLSLADGERRVTNLARLWTVFDVTRVAVLEAVRGSQRYHLSYWDALIWAVAKLNAVPNVLTEDMPSGKLVEGVRYVDPFDPAFSLSSLG